MWLPTPVYESLPKLYAAVGAAFVLGVLYVGIDTPMGPVYLILGLVSMLAAIGVGLWRSKTRDNRGKADSDDISVS